MKNHPKRFIDIPNPEYSGESLQVSYRLVKNSPPVENKEPLVLFHGLWGSVFCWRHNLDPLSEHRVLYAPDLLGHGDSQKLKHLSYSPISQTLYMKAFMEQFSIRKAVLAGNSLGGGISLLMAFEFPELVSKLILLAPACYRQALPKNIKKLRNPLFRIPFYFIPPRFFMKKALPRMYHNHDLITDELIDAHSYPLTHKWAKSIFIKSACELIPPDLDEFEKNIPLVKQKALIIWGKDDIITPVSHAERLHRELEGSILEIIPGCGHVPQDEKPDIVNRLIIDFLKEDEH